MNKVAKNYLYNLSYQILLIIVPLITTPYIARVIGAKGVGTYGYTNSIVQYFILFGCIGLNLYSQREIAYYQQDKNKRDKIFFELVILRIITVSISLVIYFFTLASHGQYSTIFMIMSLDIISSMFDISWFFQGIEDFQKIVLRNAIVKIAGVILIFTFVKSQSDLYLYILCQSSVLLLGVLSMWLYMPKFVSLSNCHNLELKRHIKPTIVLFLPQIAVSIYTTLDKTMIGALTNDNAEVAYYQQSQTIVRIVLTLVTSLGTVMLPRVANLFKQNEMEKVKEYLGVSLKFTFFLSFPMMFGLIAVSSNIVPWFLGSGYDKVVPNMMLISPILVFIAFSNVMGTQFLLPIGRQREYTLSVVLGTCINVFFNFILIPHFLSLGAAVATVIAEMCVTGAQLYFVRKDFNLLQILKDNYKYILSSIIMFVVVMFISLKLTPSIIHTLMIAICGTCIYFICLILMKDKLINDLSIKIKEKIKSL
ncbi:MAG: flippase [Thomasclavelia sp.]|jgi:O-antigen/teichoic acid export membrane protein|nr:flippase [Thomasclavelia sp.]